jgi:hypothetical protein
LSALSLAYFIIIPLFTKFTIFIFTIIFTITIFIIIITNFERFFVAPARGYRARDAGARNKPPFGRGLTGAPQGRGFQSCSHRFHGTKLDYARLSLPPKIGVQRALQAF